MICCLCPRLRQCENIRAVDVDLWGVTTQEVIDNLITSKKLSNRRDIYIKSLRSYLVRFAAKHPQIRAVTVNHIESWLAGFQNLDSRQTWLNRISTLFSFAVRRDYVPLNPCDKIDRVTIDRAAPVILSVEQCASLLSSCPRQILTYLTLALFAGIRPDEIFRLTWEDVCVVSATVKVNGKTRKRRLVPLEPVAIHFLKRCDLSIPITPSKSTVRRWRREVKPLIGGKWTADVLRHTAASMLLAKYQDAGKVAMMLGNSAQVLHTHYNNPVSAKECEAFWSLT